MSWFGFLTLFLISCSSDYEPPESWGRGIYVPARWQEARDVSGHSTHVLEETIACSACHDMTQGQLGPVTPRSCTSCHEQQSKAHHARSLAVEKYGEGVTTDCLTCHAFTLPDDSQKAPDGQPFAPEDCLRCHTETQGNLEAVVVHRPGDCLACHAPHEATGPKAAPCASCHESVSTFHTAERKDPVKRCTTCHTSQHAPAAEAREACAECHSSKEPLVSETALFDEGHTECISCHRPHDADQMKPVGCEGCHEEVHVLGSHLAAPHRNCENCHDPHDVRAASANGCENCHSDVRPNHPKHGEAGTCTGCHDPHPQGATFAKVRECSTCHASAGTDRGFHQETSCRSCHQPHAFSLEKTGGALCEKCHSENASAVRLHSGHQECVSCHGGIPHHPERLNKTCASCHGNQRSIAVSGHGDCLSCHDSHDQKSMVECRTCHTTEHRLAPEGHTSCTNCHQPHSGSIQNASCADCHEKESHTPHGELESDCSDCHRPHGPGATTFSPKCASCHQEKNLPGMHQIGRHEECAKCHTAHGEMEKPQRPLCLSCHQKQVDHYPTAPNCSSCHLFVRAN